MFFIFSAVLITFSVGLFLTKGLNYGIDFQGGILMEVRTDSLRTLVTSQPKTLHGSHQNDGETCLISAGEGEHFRCLLTPVAETLADDVKVPVSTWHGLQSSAGDPVRISPL